MRLYLWSRLSGARRGSSFGHALRQHSCHERTPHRNQQEGAHAIVIIDGAGWHTTKSLKTPDNISLLRLPAYSPEQNPQENIWQYLRQNALANRAYETYDTIVTACCKAWNDLIDLPDTIKSIASREWFQCVSS